MLAAVAAGGALGAAARYGLGVAWPVPAGGFPWVTLLVNVAGCAVLGALLELLAGLTAPHRLVRPFFGTGVLGGFTTFSTYAVETVQLVDAGHSGLAGTYVLATLIGALAAVWAGTMVIRVVRR